MRLFDFIHVELKVTTSVYIWQAPSGVLFMRRFISGVVDLFKFFGGHGKI